MKRVVNGFFVLFGFLFTGLGLVGTVLPILPTVPFLIAAAFCFARGSERFHVWFTGTKLYKSNLQTYMEHRSMTRKNKIRALGLMTVMMGAAAVWIPRIEAKIFMIAVIVFNYWYFAVKIRTISEEEEARLKEEKRQKAAETGNFRREEAKND